MESVVAVFVALLAGVAGLGAAQWADRAICAAGVATERWVGLAPAMALAFAGLAWWFVAPEQGAIGSSMLVLVAYLVFLAISVPLVVIDVSHHRLPDAIVLPAYPLIGSLLAGAAIIDGDVGSAARSAAAMAILFSGYFALRLLSSRGLGGGDVKLAGVLGLLLGWCGWTVVLVAVAASFLLGGLYSVTLIARGRANARTAIPFGPWMILGAWIAVASGHVTGQPML